MAFSWKNPHFQLKLLTFIVLLFAIFVTLQPSGSWSHSFIVEGLTNTSAIIILVLIIACAVLESPKVTEICLIIAVLVMLVICCGLWCSGVPTSYVAMPTNGYYIVINKETDRRNVYLGLTMIIVIVEIADVILHAIKK